MIEVIDFLETPKNQDILLSIMKSIQSKVYIEEPIRVKALEEELAVVPLPTPVIDLDEEEVKFKSRPKRKGDTI